MLSVSQGMLLNAYCHISSTLSEMYGEPNLSRTQNADSPVLSSPSCMVRVVSAFMERKFSLPIYLRVPEAPYIYAPDGLRNIYIGNRRATRERFLVYRKQSRRQSQFNEISGK